MTTQLLIRKTHRYLGVFIGIQLLAWTISGLYFSWNNIDNVHGDHMRKSPHFLDAKIEVVSPSQAIKQLEASIKLDSIHSIHLINITNKPVYQIAYFSGHAGGGAHPHAHYALADATTGQMRKPLTKEEAILVATDNVVSGAIVSDVKLLERTDRHDEFLERPLPAYAITFNNPDCTVYISTELGTFQTIRHNQWRVFDFLYTFHTMDYQGIDNFNNWFLKIFSALGIITVLSGFTLFYVSSRTIRKITQ
ncbi:MAG TPA: PepSY domain-containing protein [Chryseolinea sp.]|nr:PepSY domain-containing protein [Chryseolinea sp.]